MGLRDTQCRNAKKAEKVYYLNDGDGLRLLVHPNGSKYWCVRYFISGKEKTARVGQYPNLTIKAARREADTVLESAAKGKAPKRQRRANADVPIQQLPGSFYAIADEWLNKNTWRTRKTYAVVEGRLRNHVFDHIGRLPIGEITTPQIVNVLTRIEDKGETRNKVRGYLNQIFRYALVHHYDDVKMNPVDKIPLVALKKKAKEVHRRALPFDDLPKFLHDVDNWVRDVNALGDPLEYGAHRIVRIAMKLQILTMTRPGEVRFAVWSEFDFRKRLWTIPEKRMKSDREHIVPLSDQAVALLTELRKITGEYRYLFPKLLGHLDADDFDDSKTFSENTISYFIRRMGYDCQAHGFRGTASTFLHNAEDEDERPLFNTIWVEFALAHEDPDKVRGAYNSGRYLTQRTRMLQYWADQVMPG